MNRRILFFLWPAILVAVLVTLTPTTGAAQGFKWWQTERFQKELQLTTDQIARIEEEFQSTVPELRQKKQTLDGLERTLSRLIDTAADESAVMQQAERVEEVRSDLSKTRTRMLVRIRRVLNPDQRVKLVTLHDEWERRRKQQDRKR
jgi:Spy/CpxP family protein refolding chaperone